MGVRVAHAGAALVGLIPSSAPSSSEVRRGPYPEAAGEPRCVTVVISVPKESGTTKNFHTFMTVPAEVWEQLLDRQDSQIGFQELLAVILAWGIWADILEGTLWTAWVDNQGVLGSMLTGPCKAPEAALLIGQLWITMAQARTAYRAGRVESKSNVADGPSRADLI